MSLSTPNGFQRDENGWYIIAAPADDRDYSIDWTLFLAGLNSVPVDQIRTSTWNIPTGVTLGVTVVNNPTNVNTAWIATPTVGTFFVSNTIVTTSNRDFTRGFRLIVAENI